jgi:hypothetical protein
MSGTQGAAKGCANVTAKWAEWRLKALWALPSALAFAPCAVVAQTGSPPVAAPAAPATDDEGFSLDLDNTLDVDVDWPDLNGNIPEEVDRKSVV